MHVLCELLVPLCPWMNSFANTADDPELHAISACAFSEDLLNLLLIEIYELRTRWLPKNAVFQEALREQSALKWFDWS